MKIGYRYSLYKNIDNCCLTAYTKETLITVIRNAMPIDISEFNKKQLLER